MFGAVGRMAARSLRVARPRFALAAAGAAAGTGATLYNYSAPPAQAAASIPEMLATIAGKVEALEAKMNAGTATGFGSFDMAGKTVVITGGASGIGYGMCELFSQRGAKVFCLDLFPEAVKKAEDALGPLVTGIACNVADADAVTSAFTQIKTAGYRCDVVINNACVCMPSPRPSLSTLAHLIRLQLTHSARSRSQRARASVAQWHRRRRQRREGHRGRDGPRLRCQR